MSKFDRKTTEDYYCIICDKPIEEDELGTCSECDESGASKALHDDQKPEIQEVPINSELVEVKLDSFLEKMKGESSMLKKKSKIAVKELVDFCSMAGMISERQANVFVKYYSNEIDKM